MSRPRENNRVLSSGLFLAQGKTARVGGLPIRAGQRYTPSRYAAEAADVTEAFCTLILSLTRPVQIRALPKQLFDFGFFIDDVLTRNWVVFLEFQLVRRVFLVFVGRVKMTGAFARH